MAIHRFTDRWLISCPVNGNPELVVGLPAAPRPLDGLDLLAARPDAPVLNVEGEDTAQKARERFSDYLVTTSSNGALSAHKSDWAPLAHRDVVIWPDNDVAGQDYARSVGAHAFAVRARSVRIVFLPHGVPDGWDLADPLPDGISDQDIVNAVADAPEVRWEDVKDALRLDSSQQQWPPFRLPDGHLKGNKHVVAAVEEALEHIDSGCHRKTGTRCLGASTTR